MRTILHILAIAHWLVGTVIAVYCLRAMVSSLQLVAETNRDMQGLAGLGVAMGGGIITPWLVLAVFLVGCAIFLEVCAKRD